MGFIKLQGYQIRGGINYLWEPWFGDKKETTPGGDRVYDYYATLVENYGYAKSFDTNGKIQQREVYNTLNASANDCVPSSTGGRGR